MLTITIIIYGIVGVFIDRKVNKAQAKIEALQSALVALEKSSNERTKELQSKIDALTFIKVEELADHRTPASELTPKQKLRRLARAKQVVNVAFEIIKQFGNPTPLNEKTFKLMLTMIERAEKLAQAQLVAEVKKGGFERGGVVSPDNDGEAKIGWVIPKDFNWKEL